MMNMDFIEFMLRSSDVWFYGFWAVVCITGITIGLKVFAYMAGTVWHLRKQQRCRHEYKIVEQCEKCGFIRQDMYNGN